MNRIALSFAVVATMIPLAAPARANSLGNVRKALSAVSKAATGSQKQQIGWAASDLRRLQAMHVVKVREVGGKTVADTDGYGRDVSTDGRTVTVYKGGGFETDNFRVDRRGSVVRMDQVNGYTTNYSDGAGRRLSRIGGWVRWKLAKTPLFPSND